MQIIPAINADNFEEIKEKIKLLEPHLYSFGGWVQLDVADGTFTKNTIWHNQKDIIGFETPFNIEVHLMLGDIDRRINDWLTPSANGGVKRIIFHLETAKDPDFVIKKIKDAGKEPGLAIGPNISWTKLAHFKGKVNFFQILAVYPGLAGQRLLEQTYEQVRQLRKFYSSSLSGGQACIIEVDGGVNVNNAKELVEAGADILVAASAIFSGDIKKNIEELKNVFNR